MGLSATVMDLVNIAPHESFKGVSALDGGRDCVISETAGRGNCDIDNRDLFFTVTSKTHKLFTVLRDDRLEVVELVDCLNDPDELEDVKDNPVNEPVIQELMNAIIVERAEILSRRGVRTSTEPAVAGA